MKKCAWTIAICSFIFPYISQAQYYYYNDRYYDSKVLFEFGSSVGGMNCLTDLGGTSGAGKKFIKDLNLKNTRPAFSIYALVMYQEVICAKLELSFGNITAYDSILRNVNASTSGRFERGLNFKSKIADLQFVVEIHPLFFTTGGEKDPPHFSPYALAGIGYYIFNPRAKLNENWYELQPMHTEGQGFKEYPERREYKLQQVNFPIGAGIKYELSPKANLRFEFVYRFLTTDYLDDVSTTYIDPSFFAKYLSPTDAAIAKQLADRQSEKNPAHITTPGQQRGNPENKDAFFSLQLKFGLMIGRRKR
jgi:hypothetical protein